MDREGGRGKRSRCSRSRSPSGDADGDHDRHRDDDRKRRGKSSSKRRRADARRRDRSYDSRSESSSSSSSSSSSAPSHYRSSGRKHRSGSGKKRHRGSKDRKRKHKRKKEGRKKRKKSKKKDGGRSRSRSPSPPSVASSAHRHAPPGAHELASALTLLFDSYPAMATLDGGGMPLLLAQLSGGTEYDLRAMPDRNLARLLDAVFASLGVHGMERVGGGDGAWRWGNAAPSGGRSGGGGGDDLALLRLARALLDGVGVTLDGVQRFEREESQKLRQLQQRQEIDAAEKRQESQELQPNETHNGTKIEENDEDIRHRKRVERMTSQMLDRFDAKEASSSASSLSNELQGICDIILEGESVQLDGIENGKLKATLAQLFQLVGLELVEMEEDEDEQEEGEGGDGAENGNDGEKAMGYALPNKSSTTATSNLREVLRVCRFRSGGGAENAPKSWAANPALRPGEEAQDDSVSSDDDDGPAPLGTVAAAKAQKRKRPPPTKSSAAAGRVEEGGREEWMMVPGEHDFLKGIQAGGSKVTRARGFKNERQRGQSVNAPSAESAGPIDPRVQREIDAIHKAYEESRGPSLLDAHRQARQEAKQQQAKSGKKEWNWSRDKNLDDGRRVDKNALHQVMGGASTELKSKFHGSR